MDSRHEMRDFLTSRRARLTPAQAGLPVYGQNRRVPGLRREEVALLAGVSVDYYVRLERGNARGVSDGVLEALARALRLDEAERAHLFDLAHACGGAPRPARRAAGQQVRASVQRVLDTMATPAYVRNGRMDMLGANRLGRALFAPIFAQPGRGPANHARFIFLDPGAPQFYADWERLAGDTVAILRAEAGRNPHERALSDLIGELSTRSETFRTRWAAHDVRLHHSGVKRLRHPVVGELSLGFEAMELTADAGLTLIAYSAEPGSAAHDALVLLDLDAREHEAAAEHAAQQPG